MDKKIIHKMYCVKCRDHINVEEVKEETWKNGKKALKAHCPVCKTVTYKIVASE